MIPLIILKMLGIYAVARLGRASHAEALERAVLMANGGEFAFVLYAAAVAVGLLTPEENGILTAVIIISMVATPLMVILHDRLRPARAVSTDGVDAAQDLTGDVLVIGFGRVGQVVSQPLLARGFGISIIDNDVEMIEAAAEFGFKVYYGDGARLDILHAAGAADASLVAVCVDKPAAATRIVELLKAEFPLARILVRSFDRQHAVELVQLGAEYQVRETFESAMLMGRKALTLLGVEPEEAAEILDAARRRDADRFQVDLVEGVRGGTTTGLLLGNMPDRPA